MGHIMKNLETIRLRDNPDVALEVKPLIEGTLTKVGMEAVELPILIGDEADHVLTVPAILSLLVDLKNPLAKGIHMSRLYLAAEEHLGSKTLNFKNLTLLLDEMLASHSDLSSTAYVSISFDYMMRRKALVSDKLGWRFYPIKVEASKTANQSQVSMELKIQYSSTCPCSAALSRRLNQEAFLARFSEQNSISKADISNWLLSTESQTAVPHAQRSTATITLEFDSVPDKMAIKSWINKFEAALQTIVQAAVKRIDEQEFARLNGSNMMFSEDACRILKLQLDRETNLKNYKVKVEHFESLHPHNAVAYAEKESTD
jgi:GTP cyclohydrolase IB